VSEVAPLRLAGDWGFLFLSLVLAVTKAPPLSLVDDTDANLQNSLSFVSNASQLSSSKFQNFQTRFIFVILYHKKI
jgi:hypothetical protein